MSPVGWSVNKKIRTRARRHEKRAFSPDNKEVGLVSLVKRGPVGVVTLDRPPVNAIDADALSSLFDIHDAIRADASIRAVVVTGSPRVFCAGVDIRMIRELLERSDGPQTMLGFIRRIQAFFAAWQALPIPTIAALAGSATGGGLEFALASDLRVAGEDARFGLTEVKIGLIPGGGGTQRLTRVAGISTATRLMLTGELISGSEAHRLGIVHLAVPADRVEQRAFEWADELATRSPSALRELKNCLAAAPSAEGFAAEIEGNERLLAEPGAKDYVGSFFASK
jgi:enoyl-CoA hydratase